MSRSWGARLYRADVKSGRQSMRQSGQATVEYILVLVVIVIIILHFLYQFHSSFRLYAQSFFDGYVACLLETGELPGTGTTCQAEFKAYDPSAGKALLKENLPNPGDGGTGAGAGGKNGDAGKDKADQAGRGNRGDRATGEAVGGGGSGRTSIGRFGGGRAGRGESADVGKLENEGADGGSGRDSLLGVANTTPVGRVSEPRRQSVQMDFRMETEEEEKAEAKPRSVATVGKAEGEGLSSKKVIEKQASLRELAKTDNDKSFSIGEFIRFLLIVLIIVAMVIFFGGQLLQIARSRDKGGGE